MSFQVGFASDIGLKRLQNQDYALVSPELGLFIVADGMGGHKGGEIASQRSVESITQYVEGALQKSLIDRKASADILRSAIEGANRWIFEDSRKNPELEGMGTTTVVLFFEQSEYEKGSTRLTIGHVGDSRCYYSQKNTIWQLTRDHSLVQEKFRAGLITRDQLKTDQLKNVLTRSVGFDRQVEVDIYHFNARGGDVFVLCSDGLSNLVDDGKIQDLLDFHLHQNGSAQEAVDALINEAKKSGGDDNITIIIVKLI